MLTCSNCGIQNPDDCTLCPGCGMSLRMRTGSPEELLVQVADRASFIAFVLALAEEREEAEQCEQREPSLYQCGGAYRWQNQSISSFLYASLEYFEAKPFHEPELVPSWRMLAEILYYGKIYE